MVHPSFPEPPMTMELSLPTERTDSFRLHFYPEKDVPFLFPHPHNLYPLLHQKLQWSMLFHGACLLSSWGSPV